MLRRLTTFSDKYVFEKVTHIILDEVHERDINTDILLLVLRESLKNHQNLKVVLMSATLDSEQFSEYFGNCPIIKVPGHLFDVKTMYLDQVLFPFFYYIKMTEKCYYFIFSVILGA